MESDRLKNTSASPLNSDQAGPSTFQALPTPPVPASVTDGMMALKYRQVLDLAAEKLLAFINGVALQFIGLANVVRIGL
ncbi:hypothetical protein MPC1_12350002 [Methylocella tundrae]|nr:hypothetical protein MPC1_12350002 [Methylocella tundrae]